MTTVYRFVFLSLSVWALPVWAWPVDQRVNLVVGEERFLTFGNVSWLSLRGPELVEVEKLEAGELLVTAKTPGRTFLLLGDQGQFAVWALEVAPKPGTGTGTGASGAAGGSKPASKSTSQETPNAAPTEKELAELFGAETKGKKASAGPKVIDIAPDSGEAASGNPPRGNATAASGFPSAASTVNAVGTSAPVDPQALWRTAAGACPGLEKHGVRVVGTVSNGRCRDALLALLRSSDATVAKDLELTFDVSALQASLKDIEAGLKAAGLSKVTAGYAGAGLVLTGSLPEKRHPDALWTVFERSVGKVALTDSLDTEPAAPSRGASGNR